MDETEKWVKKAIGEEHEIARLTQGEMDWFTNARVVDGQGLSFKNLRFVRRAHREFQEFIWKWTDAEEKSTIIVNLLARGDSGLEKEEYLLACMRIVVESGGGVRTRDIPKARIEEFVTFAKKYGISIVFREVAELPREVIARVNKQALGT